MPEECGQGVGWNGRGEQEPLSELATKASQQVACDLVVDTFGHDLKVECVGERDQRADELSRALIVGHGGDEVAIDLDTRNRKLLKVGDRRVAGADVDEDANAEVSRTATIAAAVSTSSMIAVFVSSMATLAGSTAWRWRICATVCDNVGSIS